MSRYEESPDNAWEYLTVESPTVEGLLLDVHGPNGWELVTVVYRPGAADEFLAFLKRPTR